MPILQVSRLLLSQLTNFEGAGDRLPGLFRRDLEDAEPVTGGTSSPRPHGLEVLARAVATDRRRQGPFHYRVPNSKLRDRQLVLVHLASTARPTQFGPGERVLHQPSENPDLERTTGFEPATPTLVRQIAHVPSGPVQSGPASRELGRGSSQSFAVRIEREADIPRVVHGLNRRGTELRSLLVEHLDALRKRDPTEIHQGRD